MSEDHTQGMTDCGWFAEERADYALGMMQEQKRLRFELHMQRCEACRAECDEWLRLLAPAAEVRATADTAVFAAARNGPFPSVSANTDDDDSPAASSSPPPAVLSITAKRKLEARVRWHKVKSIFAGLMARPAPTLAAACCIVGMMLVYGLFFTPNSPAAPTKSGGQAIARGDAQRHPFIADPRTVAYRVEQFPQLAVSGYVWINGESGEVLLWIEGLLPSAERDFQAWAVQDGKHANIGVLSHVRGIAQLYVQGIHLEDADNIAVSIEPKGGSLLPTSKDSFWVSIKPPR